MSALDVGLRIQNRYSLLTRIGAGGMSEVWHADDEVLGRAVAVKVLSPRLAGDPALRAGVRTEARAVARLDHPHITRMYDYGETVLADGTPLAYLVMELVDGQTLAARLASGPLPWPDAVTLTVQVASALAVAHRAGLVHRDVKPGNVMLTPDGAKVLDFGIAAVARPITLRPARPVRRPADDPVPGTATGDDRATRTTRDTAAPRIGTPAYAAPEWLLGAPPDPAADVYGLGALLYEALTDQPAVRARNWAEAAAAHWRGTRPPPPDVPGLPARVAALCLACLSPTPRERPRAAQLAAALRAELRAARTTAATVVRADPTHGHRHAAPTVPPVEPTLGAEPIRPFRSRLTALLARLPVPGRAPVDTLPAVAEGRVGGRVPVAPYAVLAVAAAGVLAVALVGAALLDRDGPTGSAVAAPPPAATATETSGLMTAVPPSGLPAATPTPQGPTDPTRRTGPADTGRTAGPAPDASPTAVVDAFERRLAAAAAAGQVRADVALDLRNELAALRQLIRRGRLGDLREPAADLRQKVVERAAEQAISARTANQLTDILGPLLR